MYTNLLFVKIIISICNHIRKQVCHRIHLIFIIQKLIFCLFLFVQLLTKNSNKMRWSLQGEGFPWRRLKEDEIRSIYRKLSSNTILEMPCPFFPFCFAALLNMCTWPSPLPPLKNLFFFYLSNTNHWAWTSPYSNFLFLIFSKSKTENPHTLLHKHLETMVGKKILF